MALITDLITPAELTGYARESLSAYEQRKGSLSAWLPNKNVTDILVRFVAGQAGLVDEAKFRAYGAAPEIGRYQPGKRVIIELPAIGQNNPMDEYTKLRARAASDDAIVKYITDQTDAVVRAVADALEKMRGVVLTSGKATIDQANFKSVDDFGRSADMAPTAATAWTDTAADILSDLQAWHDKYVEVNGDEPGTLLVSTKIARLIGVSKQFQTKLIDGSSRPASLNDINGVLAGQGLPALTVFNRRTKSGRVTPDGVLFMLPAAVASDAWEDTELGSTFWGVTESASKPGWEIAESEQPGIVVAAFEGEKPGEPTEIISDAVALPVLANADLSLAATVA